MALASRLRIRMSTVMAMVAAAGAGSALFSKVHHMLKPKPFGGMAVDFAAILVLGIGLTAIALGAARRHTTVQTMLQMTIVFLMLLVLFQMGEVGKVSPWMRRATFYWFQACFLLTVVLPALAIRLAPPVDPDSPRSRWWRGTFEAVLASFGNLCLVIAGALLQLLAGELVGAFF